ncbi:FG-GAP repeat domain-containing protein [Pyxidicoccus sp. MSG2]|uniref:FG-GAP repeat domain-containing protein n=1 Tax=Pyxidicoccus sp. MSG2 TaxID=2996790 RepID=UPI00226F9FA1|nr:VCBS repeat-containing protein [Pyxidicoccus sp. MSG2]MCY1021267.1 VCBS repeat-containing protein [Pyxidicoccus sp. MSG2]
MSRSRALLLAPLLAALVAAPRPAPAASTPQDASAVDSLAKSLAEAVRALPAEAPVALHLSGGTAELRRAVGSVLAARLSALNLAPVVVDAPSAEAAEAAARAQGARTLVRLTLDVEAGELRARGDALGTWVNFWSGRAATRPPKPAGALAQAVEADAAVLALASVGGPAVPPTNGTAPRGVRLLGAVLARLEHPLAALATGDLDGDGRDEVAALTESDVSVFAADGRLLARRELDALPPGNATTREPFGALAVLTGPPRLAAWSTRHAHGEVLTLDVARGMLKPVGTQDAAPLGPGERGSFVPGQTAFAPEVRLADGRTLTVTAPFTTASFSASRLLFVHPDGSASLYARAGAAPSRLTGLGAGSALGDVDGDGPPELLTTSPQLQPSPDVLRVFASNGDDPTAHEPLWQGALPPGRALYVVTADLDGDKRREVVVGLSKPDGTGELFLLRHGAP